MADCTTESCPGDTLHDDRGKTETRNFNPAYQTLDRRGRRRNRPRRRGDCEQPLELATLCFLENPGVHKNEAAIRQGQDGAREKYALGPLKSLAPGSLEPDSHFAPSPGT